MEQLFSLSEAALKKTMATYLRQKYTQVVETADYVYAVGDIPIALVAHLDTVHAEGPAELFYDMRKGAIVAQEGLGADDRAGVYAILQIIRDGLRPHIILTTQEEVGAVGASILAREDCPFPELKFLIQLDRRGTNDCVFYDCDNQDFTDYISSFGFIEAYGTFTDICEICPAWGKAGVNLSIGYLHEHTYSEILFIEPMLSTIDKVKNILRDENSIEYKYVANDFWYKYYYSNSFKHGAFNGYYNNYKCACSRCKKMFFDEELFEVNMKDGTVARICCDCVSNNIDWCSKCSKAFEVDDNAVHASEYICDECKKVEDKKNGNGNRKSGKSK